MLLKDGPDTISVMGMQLLIHSTSKHADDADLLLGG